MPPQQVCCCGHIPGPRPLSCGKEQVPSMEGRHYLSVSAFAQMGPCPPHNYGVHGVSWVEGPSHQSVCILLPRVTTLELGLEDSTDPPSHITLLGHQASSSFCICWVQVIVL